jgi:hypothetical protein
MNACWSGEPLRGNDLAHLRLTLLANQSRCLEMAVMGTLIYMHQLDYEDNSSTEYWEIGKYPILATARIDIQG